LDTFGSEILPLRNSLRLQDRVARWFVFKTKFLICEKSEGPQIGKILYILWPFGKYYEYLRYFMAIW
jgi:hypothetical protein